MTWINLAGVLDVLAGQELLLGFFLAAAGLVFMIFGFRVSNVLVAISFGVLGFVLCALLPLPDDIKLAASFVGAIGLGALSTLTHRLSVAVLAGAWAGYITLMAISEFEIPQQAILGLAAIAFVAGASMTLVAFREVIAFILSMEGTLLLIGGMVVLINQNPMMWSHIRGMMVGNPVFAPFLLLAGTVTGFYWQLSELRQRDTGVSS